MNKGSKFTTISTCLLKQSAAEECFIRGSKARPSQHLTVNITKDYHRRATFNKLWYELELLGFVVWSICSLEMIDAFKNSPQDIIKYVWDSFELSKPEIVK